MKMAFNARVFVLWTLSAALLLSVWNTAYGSHSEEAEEISEWSLMWIDSAGSPPEKAPEHAAEKQWLPAETAFNHTKTKNAVWIRLKVPDLHTSTKAILLDKIYGKRITVFAGTEKIYESSYNYQLSQILLPLHEELSAPYIYLWLETENDQPNLNNRVFIGDFHTLLTRFVKSNLADIVLGSTFIFIALTMLIWSIFLNRRYILSVLSLSLVILSVGILVFTYSPFLYILFQNKGELFTKLYDLSLLILLPSFSLFFEKIFGPGRKGLLRKLRKFQIGYSVFCLAFLIVNQLSLGRYDELYYLFSVKVLGLTMIVQFMLLIGSSMVYAFKGNKDAFIFNIGFAVFAGVSLGELFRFFISGGDYKLVYWKWGVAGFVVMLIIILGRLFAQNHEQIMKYSQELKMFNHELQRSEKMEIISELAASVAHEVRNPLQVTRGFLQLLSGRSHPSEREYLDMALVELDRAAGIITDFLTFAKPEYGRVSTLQISDEFKHIEGILTPLAHLQGGRITVDIPEGIWIRGNSSKFKQALINIIKNSIEALQDEGQIHIRAYAQQDRVYIHVCDNGEGMEADELARLGEPYFSNKTKGTGLGLMVTFRIIEAMNGKIHYSSKKGAGTDAVITLPAANG